MNSIPQILDFYFRILILFLCLTVGLFVVFAGTRAALAANLKPLSVISGDVLTLGDLFDGLSPERASYVLGPAPQPGQDMVLNAGTLMRVAAALDLPWQPRSTADQVIVRRSATVISKGVITAAIEKQIETQGVNSRFDLVFSGGAPDIILPQDQPGTFEISNLRFDPQNDTFEATLSAPSREQALTEIAVSGKVRRLIEIPVLKNSLRQGEIIGARDIDWVDLYSDELQSGLILKEADLVGMTPRRVLAAGKPVRDIELEQPQIVARGDAITLVYESGPMILTTKGKALQNGARGDLVRIVNISSNRTLEGFVTAEREVTIAE